MSTKFERLQNKISSMKPKLEESEEVKHEYYSNGKIRSISVYQNGKKMSKKRYYSKGGFINQWKRENDINCIIADLSDQPE